MILSRCCINVGVKSPSVTYPLIGVTTEERCMCVCIRIKYSEDTASAWFLVISEGL